MARNPQTFRMSATAENALGLMADALGKSKSELIKECLRDLAGKMMADDPFTPLSESAMADEVGQWQTANPEDVLALYVRFRQAQDHNNPHFRLLKQPGGKYAIDHSLLLTSSVFRRWLAAQGIESLRDLTQREVSLLERVFNGRDVDQDDNLPDDPGA